MKTVNMVQLKELTMTDIPGAPILSQPIHIQGEIDEILTEKHGYCYPAYFDWNKDGKKDLLLGEFETGKKGSFIQVHLNEGSSKQPKYSGKFEYAKDINGDTITAYYWCCIGLHPRFVDLTGDGIDDLLSGSYDSGHIRMWEGTKNGFKPAVNLRQKGKYEGRALMGLPRDCFASLAYWNYTTVDFADFNQDGKLDLFVGGSGGLRIALNIGTKNKPEFGRRVALANVNGENLVIVPEQIAKKQTEGMNPGYSGEMRTYITPVDWDRDGVLDLLVTSSYTMEGQHAIDFFRGVETNKGIRFMDKKPLFAAKQGGKALPGCCTQVRVVDYNKDGVNDLLLGLSIPTIKGYTMIDSLCWTPATQIDGGIPICGKDVGRTPVEKTEQAYLRVKESFEAMSEEQLKQVPEKYLEKHTREVTDYMRDTWSIRHRGYAYVMYGAENPEKSSKSKKVDAAELQIDKRDNFQPEMVKEMVKKDMTYRITKQFFPFYPGYWRIGVVLKPKFGHHLYADTPKNREQGLVVSKVEMQSDMEQINYSDKPEILISNSDQYQGIELPFHHYFIAKEGAKVKIKITYQQCNDEMCFPPVTIEENIKL
jgi:hypothetical protein